MRLSLLFVACVGCAPTYYVADVHMSGEGLVQTKCQFDYRGHATSDCHDEVVDGAPQTYPPDADDHVRVPEKPDPSALVPAPPRPAPSDDDIARAVSAPGVHRLVEQCRSAFAPDVTAVHVRMTIAPTGDVSDVAATDVPARFAECTSHALRTANLARYDGAAVTFEQTLAL
jgi:hypothetical protein